MAGSHRVSWALGRPLIRTMLVREWAFFFKSYGMIRKILTLLETENESQKNRWSRSWIGVQQSLLCFVFAWNRLISNGPIWSEKCSKNKIPCAGVILLDLPVKNTSKIYFIFRLQLSTDLAYLGFLQFKDLIFSVGKFNALNLNISNQIAKSGSVVE